MEFIDGVPMNKISESNINDNSSNTSDINKAKIKLSEKECQEVSD